MAEARRALPIVSVLFRWQAVSPPGGGKVSNVPQDMICLLSCAYIHSYTCIRRLGFHIGCLPQSLLSSLSFSCCCFVFKKGPFWSSLILLGWLSRKPQGSSSVCFYLPSARLQTHTHLASARLNSEPPAWTESMKWAKTPWLLRECVLHIKRIFQALHILLNSAAIN